jgi:hypothetical protein
VVAFRRHDAAAAGRLSYALHATIPHLTRSTLHRCCSAMGRGLPDASAGPKCGRFRAYGAPSGADRRPSLRCGSAYACEIAPAIGEDLPPYTCPCPASRDAVCGLRRARPSSAGAQGLHAYNGRRRGRGAPHRDGRSRTRTSTPAADGNRDLRLHLRGCVCASTMTRGFDPPRRRAATGLFGARPAIGRAHRRPRSQCGTECSRVRRQARLRWPLSQARPHADRPRGAHSPRRVRRAEHLVPAASPIRVDVTQMTSAELEDVAVRPPLAASRRHACRPETPTRCPRTTSRVGPPA